MRRIIYALAFVALAGCVNTPIDNITACSQALLGANTANPTKLLQVALSTPACIALGEAAIQDIISRVSVQQRARGVRE